jgi:hypothetical protein
MYRYSGLYCYTGDEKRPHPLADRPSRHTNGYAGPSSVYVNTPQPGSPKKDIRDLLHAPEKHIQKGDEWWIDLFEGVRRDKGVLVGWETNLVGKGKSSKQPDAPYLEQLQEILDFLQEDNLFMAMDTIQCYINRHEPLGLA